MILLFKYPLRIEWHFATTFTLFLCNFRALYTPQMGNVELVSRTLHDNIWSLLKIFLHTIYCIPVIPFSVHFFPVFGEWRPRVCTNSFQLGMEGYLITCEVNGLFQRLDFPFYILCKGWRWNRSRSTITFRLESWNLTMLLIMLCNLHRNVTTFRFIPLWLIPICFQVGSETCIR